jgi:hypothetical protein
MTRLLFPGRHHVLTNFQLEYLTLATQGDPAELRDVNGQPLSLAEPIDTVLWAVTSANHSNTRRNPLPAHRREAAIEDFARDLDASSLVYLIDDVGKSERFAEYVLKKIAVESQGRFRLTPADTVVGCSTPEVIAQYERLGFRILPVELANRKAVQFRARTPWHLMADLVEAGLEGKDWRRQEFFLTEVAPATRRLYLKYGYGDLIIDLHRQPLTDDGGLTATRDYNVYTRAFDEGAERKYQLIKDLVLPGRIVDIGCCTGSLLRQLTLDDRFHESDFYGVEIAHDLFARCESRKHEGYFANDNVFFLQQNAANQALFPPSSINTFTTFSLTHELESYQGRDMLLHFLHLLHGQLVDGGRWINVDVVGPEDPEQAVWLWLNSTDGRNDDYQEVFRPEERERWRTYLGGLSTLGRFRRFQHDFRREEGYRLQAEVVERDGQLYARLSLGDACEFLSKKDYLENWVSEMHETFCYWSFSRWKQAVEQASYTVHPGSHAFTSSWLVENRYRGKAELFRAAGDGLEALPYPVTNMVLVAEKR